MTTKNGPPPGGWTEADRVPRSSGSFSQQLDKAIQRLNKPAANKPLDGVQYRLTGGPGVACIANGNTWAESAV